MIRPLARLGVVACLLMAGTSAALPFEKSELLKAAVIEKIAGFIAWPRLPGTAPAAGFTLCIAADHPQLPVLNAYYENATVADRPVAVQILKRQDPLANCQVIFLAPKDMAELPRYRAAAEKAPILLVAEGADVARNGVHVAFYFDMNRLRLEVNRKALEASGLKASFRLLEVAKIVD